MSTPATALVTGATTGIGKETSLALARAGHAVVVSGRRTEAGEAVVREIRDNGGEATFIAADVNSEDSVVALVAATVERFGRLDVAVNNAGISLDTVVWPTNPPARSSRCSPRTCSVSSGA